METNEIHFAFPSIKDNVDNTPQALFAISQPEVLSPELIFVVSTQLSAPIKMGTRITPLFVRLKILVPSSITCLDHILDREAYLPLSLPLSYMNDQQPFIACIGPLRGLSHSFLRRLLLYTPL